MTEKKVIVVAVRHIIDGSQSCLFKTYELNGPMRIVTRTLPSNETITMIRIPQEQRNGLSDFLNKSGNGRFDIYGAISDNPRNDIPGSPTVTRQINCRLRVQNFKDEV